MTDKIKNILNEQIREEMYSSNLYLAMSGRFEALNLKGMANWMQIQAKEENNHALGFFYFLLNRSVEPVISALAQPDLKGLDKPADLFAAALKHEGHITACINSIYELAKEEKDYALESFIRWYIDEQVEEEANANEIVDKIKLIGSEGPALYMLDQELAARTFTEFIPGKTAA
ncbi:MAG: ferritin [Patescibacteria group bacterium]|nr:ferritin [Patescibacteria group bacterium]